MRLQQKSLSKVTLESLLRKKRTTLENFLKETGIVTYDRLVSRCSSIGVVPPDESKFLEAKGNPVTHEYSSPTEGIVVVNPDPVSDETTINCDNENPIQDVDVLENISTSKKKKRKSSDPTA